jgi:hypothetical protein
MTNAERRVLADRLNAYANHPDAWADLPGNRLIREAAAALREPVIAVTPEALGDVVAKRLTAIMELDRIDALEVRAAVIHEAREVNL